MSSIKKINVVGTSGSGKSTFSAKLAAILGCPHVEMDRLFWGPDWYAPPDHEFFPKLEAALAREAWVLDGNYTRTIPIKWRDVDRVIWLDYSFPRTAWQATRRAWSRARSQEELWPGTGNRESVRKSFFSKHSIILWTLKTHAPVRARYLAILDDPAYAHVDFIRLRSHREADAYLSTLR